MGNQILKVFGVKRRTPNYSLTKIENWILPVWFQKQSDPLNPGYAVKPKFANCCFRNWTALCNERGDQTVQIDPEGTVSVPAIGISLEVWIHDGVTLFTPGQFSRIKQQSDLAFPGIETKSFLRERAYCRSVVFPLGGIRDGLAGMEIEVVAFNETVFCDFLVLLVIRPYDHDGLSSINRLEYLNKRVKVDNVEFMQLETEPKIIFFTHAGLGDVTEYFKFERSYNKVFTPDGNGTGLIGYSVRPTERNKIKLIFKSDAFRIFSRKETCFSNRWFLESKQAWLSRYTLQHRLLSAGAEIDYLYHTNLNYLRMLTEGLADAAEISHLLALNRFAFYSQSRRHLNKALKKIHWDGPSANGSLSPEKLIFAIADYCMLSGDWKLAETGWQTLKRIGFWLAQNKSAYQNYLQNGLDDKIFWICGAFKALTMLSEIPGTLDEIQFFKEQYQELRSELLSFFARQLKEIRNGNYFRAAFGPASRAVRCLCASYPLQLFERNERFVSEWLDQILGKYLFNGGVISPLEFQGIDLTLTAQLGEILVREERNYDMIIKYLAGSVGSGGSWPDRIHPLSGGGIGQNGHEPRVGFHFLLFLRNMMVMEEGELLYLLPGVFTSDFWGNISIELKGFPTYFGEISLKCRSIGETVQIEFGPCFRKKPQQIRLLLRPADRILFADADVDTMGGRVGIGPDFKLIRLRRGLPEACLDNTFAGKL